MIDPRRTLAAGVATIALLSASAMSLPTGAFAQGAEGSPAAGTQQQQAAGTNQRAEDDRLVLTVNGVGIRQSDVLDAIQGLPTQVQQMPAQMLLPIVLEQLLMRELILAEGYAQRLQRDPEVRAMLEMASEAAEEQAIVQVWLQRELDERITEEAVEEAFQAMRATTPNLTLERARPVIEQELEQQIMAEIRDELREGADVVFYRPTGEPIREAADAGTGPGTEMAGATAGQTATDEGQDPDDKAKANNGTQTMQPGEPTVDVSGGATAEEDDGTSNLPGLPYGELAMGTPHVLTVQSSDQYGEYIADGNGQPLYMFEPDIQGGPDRSATSVCFDECANVWPPLVVAEVEAGSGIDGTLIGTFERRNGKVQATYNGWPLYYFIQDGIDQPPQGQDRAGFGGEWYLLRPDGSIVED